MNTSKPRSKNLFGPAVDRLVCELSHDMNANFMVLEDSFRQLKQQGRRKHDS